MTTFERNTHSLVVGYILWIFGFTGAHRFYYGKKITGALWFCTGGLLGVGWLIDVVLIPGMDSDADMRYVDGPYGYNIAWVLLTFLGVFGIHRFYLGKWVSGLIYLCTLGVFGFGVLYDFFNMNELVSESNTRSVSYGHPR